LHGLFFEFKQYMDITFDSIRDIKLYQSKTGYRFSVDSLLLHDFVNLKKVDSIADLGAGSGIVGILLAKKYPESYVTLFEIQENLAGLAEKNVILNNLQDRVKVIQCDIREIPTLQISPGFDLIVSNPPFRRLKSGLLSLGEEKAVARHEIKLNLHELIDASSSLLKSKKRLCIIYHSWRLPELMDILKKNGIEPKRLRFVHSRISSEAKMVLLEAVKNGRAGLKVDRPFYIYNEKGDYTEEMKKIYT
jgi:tRNA1Val (adenine37-N6)-methyltransferase